MEAFIFYALSFITLGSAVCVVFLRRPIHNVLFMIMTMIALAAVFLKLDAEFLAMVQLIVYAGAIMVLFLFVIMLLQLDQLKEGAQTKAIRGWAGAVAALGLLGLILVAIRFGGVAAIQTVASAAASNTAAIGEKLFTTYLLPFEVASVLLLAAILGAVIIVRKDS